MPASFRTCLPLVMLVLAACSPQPDKAVTTPAADSPMAKAKAEFSRLQAQGPDATAREITKLEYALTRNLMKAGGLDAALGGEAKAEAALTALYADYERKARALQSGLPQAFVPVNEGGGGSLGGEGWGGAAASTVLGGAQAETAAEAWERGQDRGETNGHAESDAGGDNVSVVWTMDTVTLTTEVKANVAGIKGKVRTTVKMKVCPDPQGKVKAEFESVSSIAAGGGNANTRISASVEASVDDDANLIEGNDDTESTAQQSTDHGDFVDVSDRISTSTGQMGPKVNGQGGSASDQDVQAAQFMARMGRFAAHQTMRAAQKAWQSGQCIDLQVRSDPAKRKGAKPNTAYTLYAEPRAKSDGAPAGGTVKATLSGGSRLNPTGKVKADATFDYQNPTKKDERASIDFESRSKRGVGKATVEFDTKKRPSYRIDFAQCPGGGRESMRACDVSKPFTVTACGGMASITHIPSSDRAGTWTFKFRGAGGFADANGSYTLSGTEESLTQRVVSNKVCGHAAGRTVCATPKPSTATWTRIEDCDE